MINRMNFKNKQTSYLYVQLMGGLGNQLFQIAAGLHHAKLCDRKLIVDDSYGNFRKNKFGSADVLSYNIQDFSSVENVTKKISFLRKAFGLLLRMSFKKKLSLIDTIRIRLVGLTISSFLSLKFRKFVKLWSATDLGFEVIPTSRVSQYIFGYFQTYKFASDLQVKNKLKKLSVSSIEVEHYRVLAIAEKPLMIHVRLSDYLIESQFGVLSSDYYKNAISVMTEKFGFKNFWVFSDDIEKAKLIIPQPYRHLCRWIDDIDDPSVETLEKMRFGSGYIIGNSTFSWWGAFLSYSTNPPTIAPTPWFIGLDNPRDLIPNEWMLINR